MSGASTVALFFRTQERFCALPLDCVAEILRPQKLRPATGLPAFVLGVSLIRGAIVPVVDMALLLGAAPIREPARLIVLRLGARAVALAVEAVIGVRAVAAGALQDLPPLLRDAGEAVAAIAPLDHELLLVMQAGWLLAGPHMEAPDAGAA